MVGGRRAAIRCLHVGPQPVSAALRLRAMGKAKGKAKQRHTGGGACSSASNAPGKKPPQPTVQQQQQRRRRQPGSTATQDGRLDVASTLPEAEQRFIQECVTVRCPRIPAGTFPTARDKAAQELAVTQAVSALETYHMCILDGALSEEDITGIAGDFQAMLDLSGDSAIGEKDASKRSATRMYNCKCQVGPACGWSGWKHGSEATRMRLHDVHAARPAVWERVALHFGFQHIKRVEVVTSHPGCRAQDWHVDAVHGLTVIFPLVDIDARKGPTQLDFTIPFNSLRQDGPKVKHPPPRAPPTAHAALNAGSVLIFNANCSHRGTANISSVDRPILVLDTSPQCPSETTSQWALPMGHVGGSGATCISKAKHKGGYA
jgi:ectoine hydroxylase-related dioxygenase (phytanoyl-CoA dioxygenase family)